MMQSIPAMIPSGRAASSHTAIFTPSRRRLPVAEFTAQTVVSFSDPRFPSRNNDWAFNLSLTNHNQRFRLSSQLALLRSPLPSATHQASVLASPLSSLSKFRSDLASSLLTIHRISVILVELVPHCSVSLLLQLGFCFPTSRLTQEFEFCSAMAGQSDPQFSAFSPPEMEFLAEDEAVSIVPNMRMDPINLISGDYGPFRPQIATQVPLWLAVALKKRGKCTIRPPEWMSVERLTQVLEAERESPREFQPLPFHYAEISKLLFDHARDDILDVYMVRSLIEDIRDVRFHKVESGLETISARTHAVKLKNLSAMEVNIVRPFLLRTLQAYYKHDSPDMIQQPIPTSNRQLQTADRGPRRDLRRR